jgi:hypothetical protein
MGGVFVGLVVVAAFLLGLRAGIGIGYRAAHRRLRGAFGPVAPVSPPER